MQRKILYAIAFTGLIILSAVALLTNRKSTIGKRQIDFALEDPSKVDRIIIENKTNRILIEKHNHTWRLNGKYTARQETVTMFLKALGRIEVVAPAPRSIRDSIVSNLEEKGSRLALYRGSKVLKSFVLYYENGLIPGTYMMGNRKKQPYRVGLTGYTGDNIESLFSTEEAGWKDNVLFGYSPADIAAVEIEYPQRQEQSFRIIRDDKKIPYLMAAGKTSPAAEADMEEITDYLSFFSPVPYSVAEGLRYDTGRFNDPFAILTVTDQNQTVFQMRSFRLPDPGGQDYDMNRYLAFINIDSLPVILKYTDTDPVMKAYRDFLKK